VVFNLSDHVKSLREYTDDELYEILEHNEIIDLCRLSGICSEVLRRQIKQSKELNKLQ